jgi:hypothetical protein
MKYSISLFALLFVLSALNAQDTACQRLISLRYAPKKKKANRWVATITNPQYPSSSIFISEWDTLGNAYFKRSTGIVKTEEVIFDKKMYRRFSYNGKEREWKSVPYPFAGLNEDSLRIDARKIKNIPYNCQQLNDDILDGESCYVFTFEIDRKNPSVQPMKLMPKASVSNDTCTISFMKEWYTKQGRLKKIEAKTKYSYGETINVTTYEYDVSIPLIKEPLIKQK